MIYSVPHTFIVNSLVREGGEWIFVFIIDGNIIPTRYFILIYSHIYFLGHVGLSLVDARMETTLNINTRPISVCMMM